MGHSEGGWFINSIVSDSETIQEKLFIDYLLFLISASWVLACSYEPTMMPLKLLVCDWPHVVIHTRSICSKAAIEIFIGNFLLEPLGSIKRLYLLIALFFSERLRKYVFLLVIIWNVGWSPTKGTFPKLKHNHFAF